MNFDAGSSLNVKVTDPAGKFDTYDGALTALASGT